ncbi:MAG: GntR family transcriptional regulator [Tissierellia bacterium]|nr:GntR family transcriptional regulator [Tissierellia bacterium]
MKIIISNASNVPLYEQIKEAIKSEILSGELKEGEQLPSVRSLSKDLKVSILTVKKSYDELADEGFVETRQGLGSFVVEGNSLLKQEERRKILEEKLIEAVDLSKSLKIQEEEFFDLIKFIYEGGIYD